jgi:hypothetical protein
MSFLDSFSMFFQNITLKSKSYIIWKYGEKIENWESIKNFRWVIQKKRDYMEAKLFGNRGDWWNLVFTSKDFELRCNVNIEPKKWDIIEGSGNIYNVIYVEKVVIEWVHDHNVCIIRLND